MRAMVQFSNSSLLKQTDIGCNEIMCFFAVFIMMGGVRKLQTASYSSVDPMLFTFIFVKLLRNSFQFLFTSA